MITRGTPVPPYSQLAAILRAQIESGELAPGQQLPSVVALAGIYEIAVPTVRKAISLLKTEGLVTGVAGYGTLWRSNRNTHESAPPASASRASPQDTPHLACGTLTPEPGTESR